MLIIGEGAKVTVGMPVVEGAKVIATSQGEAKGDKIVVFRYKSKVRYRRKTGHRQLFTRLLIDRIVGPGAEEQPVKKVRRRKKVVAPEEAAPKEEAPKEVEQKEVTESGA